MASRWQRRSQEEKDRMHQERMAKEKAEENKESLRHALNGLGVLTLEQAAIYDEGDIPVWCHRCNEWVRSDQYVQKKGHSQNPLFTSSEHLLGLCPTCGSTCTKAVPGRRQERMVYDEVFGKLGDRLVDSLHGGRDEDDTPS